MHHAPASSGATGGQQTGISALQRPGEAGLSPHSPPQPGGATPPLPAEDSPAAGCCQLVPTVRLRLLGSFELTVASQPIRIAEHAQRLLALLAIRRDPVSRSSAANTLWPESSESRAKARLRSILWRLTECRDCHVLELDSSTLALSAEVEVDFHEATRWAEWLVDRSRSLDENELRAAATANLTADLLPHLCDEYWLTADQERFRQLRLHALEALCDRLTDVHLYSAALNAGLASVCADPLRESARRAVIRTFLHEGNRSDAVRQFASYRRLLRKELGIDPSPKLTRFISAAFTPGGMTALPAGNQAGLNLFH